MPSIDFTLFDKLLYGIKIHFKQRGITHISCLIPYTIFELCIGSPSKLTVLIAHWDIVELPFVGTCHRANNTFDIATMCRCRYDDSSWRQHFFVAILLFHRQRIFSCWDIDTQRNRKSSTGFNSTVKAFVFPWIVARPHPIGRKANST